MTPSPMPGSKTPPPTSSIPVPWFVAQPNTGPQPLNVWFTDMSILSSAVTWDFGDGSSATERSLRHTFNNGGAFTVYQKAASPYVTFLTSQTITVQDVTPPEGGFLINGGAAYTNSRAVTLNISVSEADSNTQVRFANSGEDWEPWEDLTPTRTWGLPAYDGRKVVLAQFKDNAGNLSPEVSDYIYLDKTPPTGSMTINSGAQYTDTTAVTLNLSANDTGGPLPSGVDRMGVYNMVYDSSQNAWVPYGTLGHP